MLTREQVKPWLGKMDEGAVLDMLREHHFMKQQICANELGVPTGADDWLARASQRARDLRNCENELRKVISKGAELLANAKWKIRQTACFNCRGGGLVAGEPCCICNGTGGSPF